MRTGRLYMAALPLVLLVAGIMILAGCGGESGGSSNTNTDNSNINTSGKPQLLFFTSEG